VKPSALHVQVPLPPDLLPPERWTSLVVHLPSLVAALFSENGNSRGVAVFNKIEQVGVGAHCRVRKIFTLRDAPVVDGGSAPGGGSEQLPFANGAENNEGAVPAGRDSVGFFDADNDRPQRIPKAVDFPNGVHHLLSVVYPSRLSRGAVSRERSRGSSRGNTGPGGLSEFAGVPSGGRPVVSRGSGRGVRHGNGNGDGNGNGNGNGNEHDGIEKHEKLAGRQHVRQSERWGFDALPCATTDEGNNGGGDEGWHVAFGSRVGTPSGTNRGGTPSRGSRVGTREEGSRNSARERLGSERRLSFEGDPRLAGDSNAPRAVSAIPASRGVKLGLNSPGSGQQRLLSGSLPKTHGKGGWDFMRDGAANGRASFLLDAPEEKTSSGFKKYDPAKYTERDASDDETRDVSPHRIEGLREALASTLDLAGVETSGEAQMQHTQHTHWNDSNGIAYYDGACETVSKFDDPSRVGTFTPAGSGPASGLSRPGTGGSTLLRSGSAAGSPKNYRMYTPELVMVSSARSAGGEHENEQVGEDRAALSEKENDFVKSSTTPRAGVLPESGRETPPGPQRKTPDDLDLVYDPILNFYYDPKNGKYYELV